MDHELAQAISKLIDRLDQPVIPVSKQLWGVRRIAQYLERTEQSVREQYLPLPSFPRAIRLPTAQGGRGKLLFKASEVMSWAERHQEAARKQKSIKLKPTLSQKTDWTQ